MEPTNANLSAKVIGALIIGLLVGFSAGVFWQERRGSMAPKEDTSATVLQTEVKGEVTPATTGAADTGKAITLSVTSLLVKDQPAGGRVEIGSLDTKEIIWVAIREVNDGKAGNILGAQKVFVGDGQKVTVELLRPTVSGGTYKVVLYRDIGAPAFNYREDVVVEGVEGTFSAK